MYTQAGTSPTELEYMSWPNLTPQQHAAVIPGIKLSHLIYPYFTIDSCETEISVIVLFYFTFTVVHDFMKY
jgi:hypothetical protein